MRTLTGIVSALAITASMLSTPALAAVTVLGSVSPEAANAATESEMQERCNALLVNFDTNNGDQWYADVVIGDVTYVSGPDEVGSHSLADAIGDVEGAGIFTPAHREILGDPYRNGGSVNMFGIQQAVGGAYSASSYDFEGLFTSTYAHAFSCDISVEVYHAPVLIPGHPAEGYYTNSGTNPSDGGGSCAGLSPANPHWGSNLGNCIWTETGPAVEDSWTDETWDELAFVTNLPADAVTQDQEDTLTAHEDFGEGFSTEETLLIGQVVVCISPGKKGGTWTQQNGYTGDLCTTTWYNGGATAGVPNLNTGSHNWVTVPVS